MAMPMLIRLLGKVDFSICLVALYFAPTCSLSLGPKNPARTIAPSAKQSENTRINYPAEQLIPASLNANVPKHPWKGGLEEMPEFELVEIQTIEGTIPEVLKGTFFSNGPGRNRIGEIPYGHWFDGDGMVSSVTFKDGRSFFQNKYVQTARYLKQGECVDRMASRGCWTQRGPAEPEPGPGQAELGGRPDAPVPTATGRAGRRAVARAWRRGRRLLANAGRGPGAAANTAVLFFHGGLYALSEAARPARLCPRTLLTLDPACDLRPEPPRPRGGCGQGRDGPGRWRWPWGRGSNGERGVQQGWWWRRRRPGRLWSAFGSHPKVDEATGEAFNVGLFVGRWNRLNVMRLAEGEGGRGLVVAQQRTLRLRALSLVHDFVLTEDLLVVFEDPYYISKRGLAGAAAGLWPYGRAFRWDPQKPTRAYFLDRRTLALLRTVDLPAASVYHFVGGTSRAQAPAPAPAPAPGVGQAAATDEPPGQRSVGGEVPVPALPRAVGLVEVVALQLRGERRELEASLGAIHQSRVDRRCFGRPVRYLFDLRRPRGRELVAAGPLLPRRHSELALEFPATNPRGGPGPRRYLWSTVCLGEGEGAEGAEGKGGTGMVHGLQKTDLVSGEAVVLTLGADTYFTEPCFVPLPRPRPGPGPGEEGRWEGEAEDAGWVLAWVYRAREHRSELVVVDARSLRPQARLALPPGADHHPLPFHGTFTPETFV